MGQRLPSLSIEEACGALAKAGANPLERNRRQSLQRLRRRSDRESRVFQGHDPQQRLDPFRPKDYLDHRFMLQERNAGKAILQLDRLCIASLVRLLTETVMQWTTFLSSRRQFIRVGLQLVP